MSPDQKTVLHQVCAHHPGGDQRHAAQHGIELFSHYRSETCPQVAEKYCSFSHPANVNQHDLPVHKFISTGKKLKTNHYFKSISRHFIPAMGFRNI